MARVACEGDVALRERSRNVVQAERWLAERVGNAAVVAAASHLERLPVPAGRQVDLPENLGRLRVDGLDRAHDPAERAVPVARGAGLHQLRSRDVRSGGWKADRAGIHLD